MNISFIKLDINILNDNKIKIIRKYPEGDSLIILWLGLLCMAMKSDHAGYIYVTQDIPYTTEDLANEIGIDNKVVEMGLKIFKVYKMINIVQGGVIEIINFNKHQQLDKIEKAREISRESSKKFREKQKALLIDDGHVTIDDDTEKEKEKEIEKEIELIYKAYPSKCPCTNRATSKSNKDKIKIKTLLKIHSKQHLLNIINIYISNSSKTKSYIKNFKTFLHNLPDISELQEEVLDDKKEIRFDLDGLATSYEELVKKQDEDFANA